MPTTTSAKPSLKENQASLPNEKDIDRFLADPNEYFGYSLTRMMGLSRAELDQLHISGLKRRFAQFRGVLPILDKLADSQGVNAIAQLDDVLPLLFDHAIYKSYPASLLDKHRYRQLTDWLNKFTTIDLSQVDVSACHSIDDWMITLGRETPLAVVHTSGTSGTMSFLPLTKADWIKMLQEWSVWSFQRFGHESPPPKFPLNIDCIYPFFRTGGLSHTLINDAVVNVVAGSEERFHAAYPGRLSADLMLFAARRRAAEAKGQLDQLNIDPTLAARHDEFEAELRDRPRRVEEFFTTMRTRLDGRQVFMVASIPMLLSFAENGLKQGLRKIFSPDSVVITGGGGKGVVVPDDWEDTLKAFLGTDRILATYCMSEMRGTYIKCKYGHYHGSPWIIPFILDPATGKSLPRSGTVTGRFAFYDLLPSTHWGGFVTGDEVTMVWDTPCPCGQSSPYITGKIQRYSEKPGADVGEEKISCAAAPEAYAEALNFLNDGAI